MFRLGRQCVAHAPIRCPCVVFSLYFLVSPDSAAGGEIFDQCVADNDEAFTEKDVIRLAKQILTGVAFLHRNNVVHLDLKVNPFPDFTVKLWNFFSLFSMKMTVFLQHVILWTFFLKFATKKTVDFTNIFFPKYYRCQMMWHLYVIGCLISFISSPRTSCWPVPDLWETFVLWTLACPDAWTISQKSGRSWGHPSMWVSQAPLPSLSGFHASRLTWALCFASSTRDPELWTH